MLINESIWIKEQINKFEFKEGTRILNFGAQDINYLKYQKYIVENVYTPLEKKKCKIINFDLKPGTGIDVYGDLSDENVFQKVKDLKCEYILLFNVLEHVDNVKLFVSLIKKLLNEGNIIMITVPFNYPYHEDPIDNLLRPTPGEIKEMFEGFILLEERIITDYKFIYYLLTNYRLLIKYVIRLSTPFYKYERWKTNIIPKLKYLFSSFKVSGVILKKR